MQRFCLAAILLTVLAAPILAFAPGAPLPGAVALVVAPPWVDSAAMVHAAGGQIVGLDRAPFGLLAQGSEARFAQTLMDNGAWAVLDGARMAYICGVSG